jgi:Transposase IS4
MPSPVMTKSARLIIHDNNRRHFMPSDYTNKFYKMKPLISYIVRKFYLELPLEKNLSSDEQIVSFKRNLSIKQYMKQKPYPWANNTFVLCYRNFGILKHSKIFYSSGSPEKRTVATRIRRLKINQIIKESKTRF